MNIEGTVTVGNLLTLVAIAVSAGGLLVAWRQNRRDRYREYANGIRESAGLVIAKLDRWRQISLSAFAELEVAITDADVGLVETQSTISVRDQFWQRVGEVRAGTLRRVLSEEIEIAYAGLMHYDSRIQELFGASVDRLRCIDEAIHTAILQSTQDNILTMGSGGNCKSAKLGNLLRSSCAQLKAIAQVQMQDVVGSFRHELLRIISASDSSIFERDVRIASPEEVLPALKLDELLAHASTESGQSPPDSK